MNEESTRYVDVNYSDLDKELTYTTSEVAEILNENESTIRYWCDCFSDYIHIEREGRNRKFTKSNIDDLAFTKELLKKERLTIKQAQKRWEHIKTQPSQNTKIISTKETTSQENVLNEQALLKLEEIKKQFLNDISTQINNTISQQLSTALNAHSEALEQTKVELKDYISATIEDKLEANTSNLKAHIDATTENTNKQIRQIYDKDVELANHLKKQMEKRRQQNEEQNNKKGFFGKLFKR
ncbi:MerR family transcriptional regulator [Clostridium botulinum]|nr:MerR family transcriptional regulator [Clostridium botulinum]